jgi:hypothetical protein
MPHRAAQVAFQCSRTFTFGDKAVILPATLRAPMRSFINASPFLDSPFLVHADGVSCGASFCCAFCASNADCPLALTTPPPSLADPSATHAVRSGSE